MPALPWFTTPRHAAPVGSFRPVAGFLPTPSSTLDWQFGPPRSASAQPLASWQDDPAVVLLGEAGIGKSFELSRWYDRAREASRQVDLIDLRIESNDGLVGRWRHRDIISEWLTSTEQLELFLDGVDEFPAGARYLAASLNAFLGKVPRERLRLRLASRPNAWSEELTRVIGLLVEPDSPTILALLPLEAGAAQEAAERLGVPQASGFLDWVRAHQAEPLASRPLTLEMLCGALRDGSEPPTGRASLFEHSLLRTFRGHQEQGRDLTARKRLEVGARLAACTLFANRPVIIDFDRDGPPGLSTQLADVVGGREGVDAAAVQVTRQALEETLGTGPFLRSDDGAYLWSSRTFEEYLGARFLAAHAPTSATRNALLVNAQDPEERVSPAIRGAVGWLADLAPTMWRDLATMEPRALLDSDLSQRSDEDLAFLASAWLRGIADGDYTHDLRKTWDGLKGLAHEGLATELNAWLDSGQHSSEVVRAAAHLAQETAAVGCFDTLTALVESPTPDDHRRVMAVVALYALREFWRQRLLSPAQQQSILRICQFLLALDSDQDPDDDLFGVALSVLWPDQMGTPVLLTHLRSPRRNLYFGAYRSFLSIMVRQVEPDDLSTVIDWATSESRGPDGSSGLSLVLNDLLERASAHLDVPGVLSSVVSALLDDYVSVGPVDRLRAALADRASDPQFIDAALSTLEDTSWGHHEFLSQQLVQNAGVGMRQALQGAWAGVLSATEPATQERFGGAVAAWTDRGDEAQVTRMLADAPGVEPLAGFLSELRDMGETPAQIVAEVERRRAAEQAKRARPEPERVALDPPLRVRVTEAINDAQAGGFDAFWALLHQLWRGPDDRGYHTDWRTAIHESHGWVSATQFEQERIVEAARAFLLENTPQADRWLGKREHMFLNAAFMGVAAFELMHLRADLEVLDNSVLACWAPAVVDLDDHLCGSDAYPRILGLLLERVPAAVADTWVAKWEGASGLLALRAFGDGWCPSVRSAFVEALLRQRDPKRIGALLPELLAKDVDEAHAYAEAHLTGFLADDEAERALGLQVGFALLRSGSRGALRVIEHLENHDQDAREILLQLGSAITLDEVLAAQWSVSVVGRFTELLAHHFPPPDPERDGFCWIGPEETMRMQRDRCLGVLVDLAGDEGWAAVEELARLERNLPAWTTIPYRRMHATERAGVGTWSPRSASKILRIIREGVGVEQATGGLERLREFFIDRFSSPEIRSLVRELHGGARLEAELIDAMASRMQQANSAVEVLHRRDRIDGDLFELLNRKRPDVIDEISGIAEVLGISGRV